jgi:hypothetical protein
MSNKFKSTFSYKLIYVFAIPGQQHLGLLKIGEATISSFKKNHDLVDNCDELNHAARERIDSYTKTAGIVYKLLFTTIAITESNKTFRDLDVHDVLKRSGIKQPSKNLNGAKEWFSCSLETAINAIYTFKKGNSSLPLDKNNYNFQPIIFRPEQQEAIDRAVKNFRKGSLEKVSNAHVLWNAKMRFGKTLSALEVIRIMKFKRSLIITHRPVVKKSWFDDFGKIFFAEKEYVYGSKTQGEPLDKLSKLVKHEKKNSVYFASIQDLRGSSAVGGKFDKNDLIFKQEWDFVIVDEAHEGTQTALGNEVIQTLINSTTKTKVLYLSGTPFNLLSSQSKQQFKEEEIFTWDYVNEQRAKIEWLSKYFGDSNPYEGLPKLNIFTYDLGDILNLNKFEDIEDSAFNFKEFFRVWTGNIEKDKAKIVEKFKIGSFVHEKEVINFLDLLVLKGDHNYPYSTSDFRENFRHTLWMMPGVKEAKAMSKLLKEHDVFKHFDIVNVAGEGDEEVQSKDALKLVEEAITDKPYDTRTITLSCGRLTTGVTVEAWSAVFMLSGSSSTSAGSYLQTIFRVQTPANINGKIKTDCYVFDFAPDRTLKMIAQAGKISTKKGAVNDDKTAMSDFLKFCPVIGIKGSEMKYYDAENMMIQLKKAIVDQVARNGFDDKYLYNEKLLKLTDDEISNFEELKGILKPSSGDKSRYDIPINDQGLDGHVEGVKDKPKRKLSKEEEDLISERIKRNKERSNAISILRGIAIRIPLLVYGAEFDIKEKIDVNNFVNIVDDKSWIEFMPKGVTKDKFIEFSKYFDNEVFVEAGLKIRRQAKAADQLEPLERVQAISKLFSTFKNPDRETVLTPWRAVNMHLGQCIGGSNFYNDNYENQLVIDEKNSSRWIEIEKFTKKVFSVDSKIIDLNSKTGLYPLYTAISIYQKVRISGLIQNVQSLWEQILLNNIFAVTRTKMAKAITERTLIGFKDKLKFKTNVLVIEDIVERLSKDYKYNYKNLVSYIKDGKNWKIEERNMKFNAVVGNPPYQSESKQQIYADFYLISRQLGEVVSLIFPVGWQEPKSGNNLSKLNNSEVKEDKQIVFIDNRQNVFPGIAGAEWTNFILWEKDYDNKLGGLQLVLTNGNDPIKTKLLIEKTDIKKPSELIEFVKIISSFSDFESIKSITSARKPYGLGTNSLSTIETISLKKDEKSLKIYGLINRKQSLVNVSKDFILPKKNKNIYQYKVFVPYAWGNMDEKSGLGGAFSDVVVGSPNEICTESFLEQGPFKSKKEAQFHAKYILTKFARACLYVNKYSQHSTTAWSAVPKQDYSETWWNESISKIEDHLFKKYKIKQDIVNYIKNSLQEKSEKNIVNFDKNL